MPQPIPPNYMAYDRTIVVFSPDGRLLQVEYARQMVKNGSTSMGIRTADSVVLGAHKAFMPLAVADSYKKIYEVDKNIAIASSGSLADARNLVDYARVKAQINRVTYNEPISVSSLTQAIANRKHLVTQYAGVRPFGVGLLIGGVDETGAHLYETEPSGTMIEWKAQAIGKGADKAKRVLSKDYKDSLDTKSGIKLLVRAMKASEKDISEENLDVLVVRKQQVEKISTAQLKSSS